MKTPRALVLVFTLVVISVTIASAQTWTTITNTPPFNPGAMLLLTDGRVLVHSEPNCESCMSTDYNSWYTFTPDITGSYLNGTWTQVAAPTGYSPLYFGSAVLADGKVIVEGGEYDCSSGTCASAWQDHGAFYDPVKNEWTAVSPPAKPFKWTTIGDAQSVVLPNGTYMQANCCGVVSDGAKTPQAAVLHESTLTWTEVKDTGKADEFDEEGWTLLPNGTILTVDAYVGSYGTGTGTNSEIYTPSTQSWASAGSTIVQLWDSCEAVPDGSTFASYEMGPAVLRPDGTVFATGANSCGAGNTAIYDTKTGTWTAGPSFTGTFAADDAPAALEPNGNVIVFTGVGLEFMPPGQFFEWNGSTLSTFTTPTSAVSDGSYVGHLLILPTGQIMFTDFSTTVEVLTPAGTYESAWQPTITSLSATHLHPGELGVKLTGTQLNGLSQGSAYGDDFQDATNYPLVRITNNATEHVFYCRTHNHSTMGVATGSQSVTTEFDVPADTELGESELVVVANGIPSSPASVKIVGPVQTH
jgi:hypothetical protein